LEAAALGASVPDSLRDNLCLKCIHCLQERDVMLTVAALRCLVAIGETKRLSPDVMKNFVRSRNMTLTGVSYVTVAKMAMEGVRLPIEMLDYFISKWKVVPLAETVVTCAAKDVECARYLVNKMVFGGPLLTESGLRILVMAAKHKKLRGEVKAALDKLIENRTSGNGAWNEAVELLKQELNDKSV
jgi:hypothetical protein